MRTVGLGVAAVLAVATAGCASGGASSDDGGKVTIKFAQWWEPEMPKGVLKSMMDEFHEENPDITVDLVSNPYSATQQQIFAAASANTMPDVVGLDGAWVNQLTKQGALADLGSVMKDKGFDASDLTSQIKINGTTMAVPVVNFVYPLFTNDTLLAQAGVTTPPKDWSEFESAASAIKAKTSADPYLLPLSLTDPSGVQNNVMSWAWASGDSMLTESGKPDLTNKGVTDAVNFIKGLYDKKETSAGAFTLQPQDMVQNFTNGKAAMMVDSLAHVTTIREGNPDLKFSISSVPAKDGYTGKRGIPYAAWSIGIAKNSPHQDASWKLVKFLMSKKTNGDIATAANGFPALKTAKPDFSGQDPLYEQAFEIYQEGYPANEFVGLPNSTDLMHTFDQQLQSALAGDQSVAEALKNTQASWSKAF
jgi:multiple sugar transport system substrate-binding protein